MLLLPKIRAIVSGEFIVMRWWQAICWWPVHWSRMMTRCFRKAIRLWFFVGFWQLGFVFLRLAWTKEAEATSNMEVWAIRHIDRQILKIRSDVKCTQNIKWRWQVRKKVTSHWWNAPNLSEAVPSLRLCAASALYYHACAARQTNRSLIIYANTAALLLFMNKERACGHMKIMYQRHASHSCHLAQNYEAYIELFVRWKSWIDWRRGAHESLSICHHRKPLYRRSMYLLCVIPRLTRSYQH